MRWSKSWDGWSVGRFGLLEIWAPKKPTSRGNTMEGWDIIWVEDMLSNSSSHRSWSAPCCNFGLRMPRPPWDREAKKVRWPIFGDIRKLTNWEITDWMKIKMEIGTVTTRSTYQSRLRTSELRTVARPRTERPRCLWIWQPRRILSTNCSRKEFRCLIDVNNGKPRYRMGEGDIASCQLVMRCWGREVRQIEL